MKNMCLRCLLAAVLVAGAGHFGFAAEMHRGPTGFGNIPYGSSSDDAIRLNHGNGRISQAGAKPVMAYKITVLGLTFEVTQNYNADRKAVDALAVSSFTDTYISCVAQFNYVLDLLQSRYGRPAAGPLNGHDVSGGKTRTYTVPFEFDRQDGIQAKLISPDPDTAIKNGGQGGSSSSSASSSPSASSPCIIQLHYLPPGWVGHF
jgi:hypothetical protein